jgi:D-aminoacyl-tRNA deacylase
MILLVASTKDIASLNIAKQIKSHYSFKKMKETFLENPVYSSEVNRKKVILITLKEEAVYAQNLTHLFKDLELVVFISRHSSASGTPTLSVHTPGNLGEAELGGLPRKVSVAPATAMRDALKAMARFKEEMRLDYAVTYECTHHGPSLDVPTMFAELGSAEKQWSDSTAAEAVAHGAMEAISKFNGSKGNAVLGIGGPHYNERFTKLALRDGVIFGHIIPKYSISCVDAEILSQCVEKTVEKVECAVLDWKGIRGENKPRLLETLQKVNLRFKKI